MSVNSVRKRKDNHLFILISFTITFVLIFIMINSSLQKRLPFLLCFAFPFASIRFIPKIKIFLLNSPQKRIFPTLMTALAGATMVIFMQLTLLPFVQHRLNVQIEVLKVRNIGIKSSDRMELLGIGNASSILHSSEEWQDFEWQWRNGARMGRYENPGDTDLFVSWNNPYLYFSGSSNPNFHFTLNLNGYKSDFILKDFKEGQYYKVPVPVDSWAFIIVTILLFVFSFVSILFFSVKVQKSSAKGQLLISFVFLFFIFTPLLLLMLNTIQFNPAGFEESEKRPPYEFNVRSQIQNFSLKKLDTLPQEFENWFNDHFGFREQIIQIYAFLDYKILNESFMNDRVIAGKNGFLFVNDFFQKVISKQRGAFTIPNHRQKKWVTTQEARYQYLNDKGIEFFYFIAPNKHSVYSEHLPHWATVQVDDSFTDNLIRRYGLLYSTFPLIDSRPSLIEAKEEWGDILYGKTDTHWTFLGAYIAYKTLVDRINEETEWNIPYIIPEKIDIIDVPSGFHLTKMLKLNDIVDFNDHSIEIHYKESETGTLYKVSSQNRMIEIEPFHRVPWDSTYRIMNSSPLLDKKVLIFRDSFASQMSPLLNETFSEIIYIHYNNGLADFKKLVQQYEPDMVIIETGERGMNTQSLYEFSE